MSKKYTENIQKMSENFWFRSLDSAELEGGFLIDCFDVFVIKFGLDRHNYIILSKIVT